MDTISNVPAGDTPFLWVCEWACVRVRVHKRQKRRGPKWERYATDDIKLQSKFVTSAPHLIWSGCSR